MDDPHCGEMEMEMLLLVYLLGECRLGQEGVYVLVSVWEFCECRANRVFLFLFKYGNSVIHVINSPRKIKAPIIDISARSKCILETCDMEKLGLSPKVHDGMHQNNSDNL